MLRLGVIGFGLRRSLALEAHRPPDVQVVALADPRPKAQERFSEAFGPQAFVASHSEELLSQGLDAVMVLSPDHLHERHAIQFLEAGVPVYLEKPMAITTEGCDAILQAAKTTGSKLYLGHNMRHFAVVRKMKEWIAAGRIGEVKTAWCRHFVSYGGGAYFADWHADRRNTTGLLLQKGAHDLDVLHWLCSGYAKRVSAMGELTVYGNLNRPRDPEADYEVDFAKVNVWPPSALPETNAVVDVEDLNLVTMQLDNGVLAGYQQCHFTPDAWRSYCIIGTEGRIENFDDRPGTAEVRLWNRFRFGYDPEGDDSWRAEPATGGHGGADHLILNEFFRYLREGGETDTSPIAARMAVAAGVAATQSVRSGGVPVDVPPLPTGLV